MSPVTFCIYLSLWYFISLQMRWHFIFCNFCTQNYSYSNSCRGLGCKDGCTKQWLRIFDVILQCSLNYGCSTAQSHEYRRIYNLNAALIEKFNWFSFYSINKVVCWKVFCHKMYTQAHTHTHTYTIFLSFCHNLTVFEWLQETNAQHK